MQFSLVGTGNAAWHFAKMLRARGHTLLQIYTRNAESAKEYQAEILDHPEGFSDQNDLIIIAVKDDAIEAISAKIPAHLATIHVSGATSIEVLSQSARGVVWPVQTIRKGEETDHRHTPFLIEAATPELRNFLIHTFSEISDHVYEASGEQRAQAHMATVFANNFTTQLLDIAEKLLGEHGLPLNIAIPSVKEVLHKLETRKPFDIQTGPARRADMETLHKQLNLLKDKPELQEIYTLFTNRILRNYHGHEL